MFKVKNLETGEMLIWNVYDILCEINKDRESDWENYNEDDYLEGWYVFCEGHTYSLVEIDGKKTFIPDFYIPPHMNIGEWSRLEDENYYGNRTQEIDTCYEIVGSRYYRQLEDSVLHVHISDDGYFVINNLPSGYLNKMDNSYKKISLDHFCVKMKEVIYHLQINDYWKPSL